MCIFVCYGNECECECVCVLSVFAAVQYVCDGSAVSDVSVSGLCLLQSRAHSVRLIYTPDIDTLLASITAFTCLMIAPVKMAPRGQGKAMLWSNKHP